MSCRSSRSAALASGSARASPCSGCELLGGLPCLAMTCCARSCSSPQGHDGNTAPGTVTCCHPLLQMGAGDVGGGGAPCYVITVGRGVCACGPVCNKGTRRAWCLGVLLSSHVPPFPPMLPSPVCPSVHPYVPQFPFILHHVPLFPKPSGSPRLPIPTPVPNPPRPQNCSSTAARRAAPHTVPQPNLRDLPPPGGAMSARPGRGGRGSALIPPRQWELTFRFRL